VFECFYKFVGASLLRQVASHLELLVFLLQTLVELRQLSFDVVLDVFLLVANDLKDFILEPLFGLLGLLI
jgi:hypothetical protein